ncbi:MAG: TonB-dependent receptor, partial [Pseudomonadales bacterium]
TGAAPGPGAGADMGGDETYALRGTLLIEPNDDLSISVSANIADAEVDTGPYQSKSVIGIYNSTPTIAGPTFPNPASIVGGAGELINVIDTPAGETRLSIVQGTALDGGCDPADVGLNSLTCFGTAPAGRPVPGGDFFGYNDPDGADHSTSGDFAFEDQGNVEAHGLNVNLEYQLSPDVTLTSVTDYKDYEKLLFIDVDAGPANTTANYAAADSTSFTQELRFSGKAERMNWVAGLYYLNIDTDSDNGLKVPPGSVLSPNVSTTLFAVPTSATLGGDLGTDAKLETDSYSIFGQLEYDLYDDIKLTVGLRAIREEKDYEMTIGAYPTSDTDSIHQGGFTQIFTPVPTALGALGLTVPGGTFTPPGGPTFAFEDDTSDTLWTGKIQLDWTPTEDLLVYAGINRGVKAGSFNAPLIGSWVLATLNTGSSSFLAYDEEVLLAYEVGFKSTVLDGSARINGSVYYYDYTDYQAFLFTGIGGNVINADAETVGAELEIQTSPAEGWDAMLAISWFDATVEDVPLSIGSSIVQDVDPTYAPEFQVSGILRYEWPMFNGSMAIQGDFNYSDEFFYNLRNFDADKFDSYTMVNARLSWTSADEIWETSFSIRNVTDEEAGIMGFDLATACGCNEVSYQPPRWYGANLRYTF